MAYAKGRRTSRAPANDRPCCECQRAVVRSGKLSQFPRGRSAQTSQIHGTIAAAKGRAKTPEGWPDQWHFRRSNSVLRCTGGISSASSTNWISRSKTCPLAPGRHSAKHISCGAEDLAWREETIWSVKAGWRGDGHRIPFPGLLGGTRYLARRGVTRCMVWDREKRKPTAMAGIAGDRARNRQAVSTNSPTAGLARIVCRLGDDDRVR